MSFFTRLFLSPPVGRLNPLVGERTGMLESVSPRPESWLLSYPESQSLFVFERKLLRAPKSTFFVYIKSFVTSV